MRFGLAALSALLMACGGDLELESPAPSQPPVEPPGCAIEERLIDDVCVPPGVSKCSEGFVADDQRGCEPILPAAACGDGLMAVPGDTACAPPGPCGAGPYGDGPFDAATQYVDATFTGNAPDGSSAMPWPTVQQAIDAAPAGGSVAVAAGRYAENLVIRQSVRLLGRCAEQVTVEGAVGSAAITVRPNSAGTVLAGLAVTGGETGVLVDSSEDVVIEQVRIHDTGYAGLSVVDDNGPAAVTARRLLVERATVFGVNAVGSALELAESVVRHTAAHSSGSWGWNARIEDHQLTGRRASLVANTSLFEAGQDVNINMRGSDLQLSASVVRDTTAASVDATRGYGLRLEPGDDTGDPSSAQIAGSLIRNNRAAGIAMVAGALSLEQSVVSDTQPDAAADWFGRGITAEDVLGGGARPVLSLSDSLIARNRAAGVIVLNGEATLVGVRVADTSSRQANGLDGDGLVGQTEPLQPTTRLDVQYSALERNSSSGLTLLGAQAFVSHSAIRDTLGNTAEGRFGRGITVQAYTQQGAISQLTIEDSLVERNFDVGINVTDSTLSMTRTTVRDTFAHQVDGLFGDGVAVYPWFGSRASATIVDSRVENAARAGISTFDSLADIGGTELWCNPVQLNGEGDFEFVDSGGNACGCDGGEEACTLRSSGLLPPTPTRD